MTSDALPRLGARARLRLALETASTYVRVRRFLRGTDLPSGLARVRAWADRAAPATRVSLDEAVRLGRAVTRTLTVLPADSRCLMSSVVLVALLARRGATGTLVIGVRPGTQFGAHAWVELDGDPLLPSGGQFARLVEL